MCFRHESEVFRLFKRRTYAAAKCTRGKPMQYDAILLVYPRGFDRQSGSNLYALPRFLTSARLPPPISSPLLSSGSNQASSAPDSLERNFNLERCSHSRKRV